MNIENDKIFYIFSGVRLVSQLVCPGDRTEFVASLIDSVHFLIGKGHTSAAARSANRCLDLCNLVGQLWRDRLSLEKELS